MKLLLATTNRGKIKEFKQALKNCGLTLITPKQELRVAESGRTFSQNAIIKAQAYANKFGLLTLADDSGLVVKALNGRPGVYSNRYGPTARTRNSKLLRELKGVKDRRAYFETVIALYQPKTKKVKLARGKAEGKIITKPTGKNGFGYDPIFWSKELKKTFAQATTAEKNKVSHRGKAISKLCPLFYTCRCRI